MTLAVFAFALLIFAQQQPLPSAPEPKPTPVPFQIPANAPPPHAAATPEPDDRKTKGDQPEFGALGVDPKLLTGPDGFALKEFLRQRVNPTIRRHWELLIPEIAKGKRTWYGTIKNGKAGNAVVSFILHKDGTITDILLDESSGDAQMDSAALQAVKNSEPLPLWSSFKGNELKIRGKFMYNPKHHP